jgi:N-acetylgalactosamine-N,N'-diacetylbacillosaminyl-diphospho-undecaprenol 4-alpha-N-acetylgalactosaminyltransferase
MTVRRNIAFVINSLVGGGAERIMCLVAGAIRARYPEHAYSMVLLDDEPRAYAPPDGMTVVDLRVNGGALRSARALIGHFRAARPDVTLSFLTRSNVASVVSGRLLGHRTVISERVNTTSHLGSGPAGIVARATVRLAYPHADQVVAPSEGVADELVARYGVRRERLSVVPNPVDVDGIAEQAREEPAIGIPARFICAVGRLMPNKNHAMLIEAYAAARPDADLVILGDGPLRAELSARATALGVADRVHLPGFVANPHAVLARAAFYVSASNSEGFPNSLVEAMAIGLPVVATNCLSGPSEVLAERPRDAIRGVVEAQHGILVPTGDVDALAGVIARLAADAPMRTRYGAAARARAGSFGIERTVDGFWAAIERALAA